MPDPIVFGPIKHLAGTDVFLANPVLGLDGEPLVRADITSWTLKVYEIGEAEDEGPKWDDAGDVDTAGSYDGSEPAIFYDTLQKDSYWKGPGGGYNFLYRWRGGSIEQRGGASYLLRFEFETVEDGTVIVLWRDEPVSARSLVS